MHLNRRHLQDPNGWNASAGCLALWQVHFTWICPLWRGSAASQGNRNCQLPGGTHLTRSTASPPRLTTPRAILKKRECRRNVKTLRRGRLSVDTNIISSWNLSQDSRTASGVISMLPAIPQHTETLFPRMTVCTSSYSALGSSCWIASNSIFKADVTQKPPKRQSLLPLQYWEWLTTVWITDLQGP